MPIQLLSEQPPSSPRDEGRAVALVGSFAPVHDGHFDALLSAACAVEQVDDRVEALTLVPNSSAYVRRKLGKIAGLWRFQHRVESILNAEPDHETPTYVDDISGARIGLEQINYLAPRTIEERLGFDSTRTYLVVGSDQLLSMEEHLSGTNNRAVCVIRPGRHEEVEPHLRTSWLKAALHDGRFIVTRRANMDYDVSSTDIRDSGSAS